MASIEESGFFSPTEKVPVQCLDDPFGFDAEVVYGHKSFRLKRCTGFLTSYRTQHTRETIYVNERPGAQAEDSSESGHQQDMPRADIGGQAISTHRPVRPEDTDSHNNLNHLPIADGGPTLTMATGGIGYKSQKMDNHVMLEEEEFDNRPKKRMKKGGKRGVKKSRLKHRR